MPRIHFWNKSLWEILISLRFRAWFALHLGQFLDEDALFKYLGVLKPKRIFLLYTMIYVAVPSRIFSQSICGSVYTDRGDYVDPDPAPGAIPVPVKTGWWPHWEQLREEGFGVTDGWKTGHEPAMCTHRSRKATFAASKEAWPSGLEFKVLNDGYAQCGGLHSSQQLPAFPLLPTQWINLMREGKVQHYNKCFHMPLLKPALLLI